MKTVYEVTRNGTPMGTYDDVEAAMGRADDLERTKLLWASIGVEDGCFAFGPGDALNRNEYEIKSKRVRS